jgi:hypothetical protein
MSALLITCHDFGNKGASRKVAPPRTPRDAAAMIYGLALAHRGKDLGFAISVTSKNRFGYFDLATAYAGHDAAPVLSQLIDKAEAWMKVYRATVAKDERRGKFLRPYFAKFDLSPGNAAWPAFFADVELREVMDREDWPAATARLKAQGFDLDAKEAA